MRLAPRYSALSRSASLMVLAIILVACGGGGGTSPVPASATQTAAPSTASTPSTTSPATPAASGATGAATLSWVSPLENIDGSVLLNLSGFKIYYGQSANSLISTISITNASVSTYVVDSLTAGTWYFGVSAVNSQGVESPLSNIASKTIG